MSPKYYFWILLFCIRKANVSKCAVLLIDFLDCKFCKTFFGASLANTTTNLKSRLTEQSMDLFGTSDVWCAIRVSIYWDDLGWLYVVVWMKALDFTPLLGIHVLSLRSIHVFYIMVLPHIFHSFFGFIPCLGALLQQNARRSYTMPTSPRHNTKLEKSKREFVGPSTFT